MSNIIIVNKTKSYKDLHNQFDHISITYVRTNFSMMNSAAYNMYLPCVTQNKAKSGT